MNNLYTEQIINETVDNVLLEFKKGSGLAKLVRKYQDKIAKGDGESIIDFLKKLYKQYREDTKDKRKFRKRKKKGGGTELYDKTEYDKTHKKTSVADAQELCAMIDQEKTDIAAVAREIFPHHTDEGAQSQLRKILNGERPMTEDVASKLRQMIDSGQICVK